MVKSKKMSKTGIAVIVLALLLVLSMVMGLTGAWFTKSGQNSSGATNPVAELSFGSLGNVSVTAVAGTWKDADGEDVSGRTVVMPGDEVKTGSITFTYENAGTEANVYYLIYDGHNYYTLDQTNGKFVPSSSGVGTIAKGGSVTVNGAVISIKCADGKWYALDGVKADAIEGDGTLADPYSSCAIPTTEQGLAMSSYNGENASVNGAAYYFAAGNTVYQMAVVQTTNMTSEAGARLVLVSLFD